MFSIGDPVKRRKSSKASSSSMISMNALLDIVDRLKNDRVRLSTRANYYGIWKHFNEFYIKLDIKPETWEERLVLFAGLLADSGRKGNTIKSYILAIKAVLKEDGVDLCEDKFLLSAITKACKYKNEKVHIRFPIQKGVLVILLNQLEEIFAEQPYLERLYKALFTTVYYGLFRVGELTMGSHPVRASDVHIGSNKNKMLFVLHTSKTHWKDSCPQTIKISSTIKSDRMLDCKFKLKNNSGTMLCPYTILRNFLSFRSNHYQTEREPFFIFRDRTPVKPVNFTSVLKQTLKNAGLNPKLYTSHGFRSGRAVDLLGAGISMETIRKFGRWRSGAVYQYLKST